MALAHLITRSSQWCGFVDIIVDTPKKMLNMQAQGKRRRAQQEMGRQHQGEYEMMKDIPGRT